MMRIGIGYDIHRLVTGRKLILGAVEVPYSRGLAGHSDADVVLHALCDALLGACGLGDIGEHFPDTEAQYKGISSVKLLKRVASMLAEKNYAIGNIDVVIIAQEPKLSVYKDKIRMNICRALGIRQQDVNIKAKTNEGQDATGRKKAIACYAVACIISGGDAR